MQRTVRLQWGLAVVVLAGCLTAAHAATTLQVLAQATLPTVGGAGPGVEQVRGARAAAFRSCWAHN
jgi:hypothetical protein